MISIIAAIGKNRELGKDNKLLWNIPEDLKRFRQLTQGHAVIMGRKTFESIGRPLPNRLNIIITRDKSFKDSCHPGGLSKTKDDMISKGFYQSLRSFQNDNTIICNSLEQAIEEGRKIAKEIFVIGGGQIYSQAIKIADKLYLTIVEGKYEADTYFPEYSEFKKVIFEQKGESDGYKYTFLELER